MKTTTSVSVKKDSFKNVPTYDENPFIENMDVKTVKKKQIMKGGEENLHMIIDDEGNTTGHSVFMRHIEVDEEQFAKLYIKQLGALWDLPKQSLRVLSYILKNLKPNNDTFIFDTSDAVEHCEYKSHQSVYLGLYGLIKANIIARSNKHYLYYINPLIVFNGSRVTFATTYNKRKNKAIEENPNQTKLGWVE